MNWIDSFQRSENSLSLLLNSKLFFHSWSCYIWIRIYRPNIQINSEIFFRVPLKIRKRWGRKSCNCTWNFKVNGRKKGLFTEEIVTGVNKNIGPNKRSHIALCCLGFRKFDNTFQIQSTLKKLSAIYSYLWPPFESHVKINQYYWRVENISARNLLSKWLRWLARQMTKILIQPLG